MAAGGEGGEDALTVMKRRARTVCCYVRTLEDEYTLAPVPPRTYALFALVLAHAGVLAGAPMSIGNYSTAGGAIRFVVSAPRGPLFTVEMTDIEAAWPGRSVLYMDRADTNAVAHEIAGRIIADAVARYGGGLQ